MRFPGIPNSSAARQAVLVSGLMMAWQLAAKTTRDSLFLAVNVWRQAAENVAESMTRGTRAIVTGRLRQRSYETKEGDTPTSSASIS